MPALYSPSALSAVVASPAHAENMLAACYPGSMAPHFRVQTLSGDALPQWKLAASFADLKLAQICLDRLRRQGQAARLIAYRRVPTAA